ncbi:MAG: tetratricopeptide repeat protein, partial [Opitutales bacterium]
SPLHFDAITSVDEPFYDFFDVQLIQHLSEEETVELVRKNLEWENTEKSKLLLQNFDTELRPKIYALYRMTAGNPRLNVMLYELIAHDSITEVRQQLEVLLDRITPFYQDRLNDLPPQERAVLETMARMRDMAKTPAAITERMRLSQNKTSMLLKRLSDAHYIHSFPNPADKRSRIYAIRERFFDIWLVMNVSRAAQKRIPYLLDFFALVYPSLEERNRKRAELLAKNDLNAVESLAYLSELGKVDEKRQAKYGLAEKLSARGKKDEALTYLRESYELDGEPKYEDYLSDIEEMIECWDYQRGGDLEAFANKLTEMSKGLTYKSWSETKILFLKEQLSHLQDPEKRIEICLRLASLLSDLARWDKAENLLRKALKEAENAPSWKSTALNNLASLLNATNRLKEAEPLMREALKIDQAAFGENDPIVAIDLNNLAILLKDTNRFKEAEPLMRQALRIDQAAFGEDHPNVAIRLNNLASLLKDTNRLKEAEPLIRQALEIDQAAFGEDHPSVAIPLSNLASLLQDTNRLQEAEPLMRQALKIDQAAFGEDHPNVAISLNNLASLLQDTNRLKEAEPLMHQALRILHKFRQGTGHIHPNYDPVYNNYEQLLREQKIPEDQIAAKLAEFSKPSDQNSKN